MDLITTDGRNLHVTESQNSDLFWGLCGGGGNFGIVTAFEYRVHQLEEVVGGFLVFPIESMGDFLEFYQDFMANAPDELMVEIAVAKIGRPLLIVTVCFAGEKTASEKALAPIRSFASPLFDGIKSVNFAQLTVPSAAAVVFMRNQEKRYPVHNEERDGYYNHWRGASVAGWTGPAIRAFVRCVEQGPAGWSIGIGHFMHSVASRVEAGSTPLLRNNHSSSFFFNVGWNHSGRAKESMAWVDQSIEAMSPHVRSGTYVNYLSSNAPDAVRNAYGSNYARLRRLKSKYNPDILFACCKSLPSPVN